MMHAQSSLHSSLLDLALPTRTPSLQFPSHGDTPPNKSASTGYEPNDLIEVNHSEVTPIFFQARQSRVSTYNSGEDIATTPMDWEVDDDQNMGMLASPLYIQGREASAESSGTYHSNRQKFRNPCIILTQKKVEPRISFRQRKDFLKTSRSSDAPGNTSKKSRSRRTGSFIETL